MMALVFYLGFLCFAAGFVTGSMVGASVERNMAAESQAMKEREV